MKTIKERCKDVLITLANKHSIPAMVICIKEGIDPERYLEDLANIAETSAPEDDYSYAVKAATEGYKLADIGNKEEEVSSRIPAGALNG
jgi:hypothetical protein